MSNLRGRNYETKQKDVTKLGDKDYCDLDRSGYDFYWICCDLLEIVIYLDKLLKNYFIQRDVRYL